MEVSTQSDLGFPGYSVLFLSKVLNLLVWVEGIQPALLLLVWIRVLLTKLSADSFFDRLSS